MSLLEILAALLLSSASALVLWAIRLCDSEPEAPPVAPRTRADAEPPLRRAA